MKIWIDAKNPAPSGYHHKQDAQEVIETIKHSDFHINRLMKMGNDRFLERDYVGRNKCYAHANKWDITEINMSQEYATSDDAKKLVDYIFDIGRIEVYPIKIH